MGHGAFTPENLMAAVVMISRAMDSASLPVLQETHRRVEQHFFSVAAGKSLENATEQRVLGILWAELEMAIDVRLAAKKK